MRLFNPFAGIAFACLMLTLGGCSTLQSVINAGKTAAGISISSGRVLAYNDGLRTIQDAATSYMNGCVAAKSTTGFCAYGDQAYADLKIMQSDRDALKAYAKTHDSVPIGAGGVLALTETAVSNVQTILKNAGIATPNLTP